MKGIKKRPKIVYTLTGPIGLRGARRLREDCIKDCTQVAIDKPVNVLLMRPHIRITLNPYSRHRATVPEGSHLRVRNNMNMRPNLIFSLTGPIGRTLVVGSSSRKQAGKCIIIRGPSLGNYISSQLNGRVIGSSYYVERMLGPTECAHLKNTLKFQKFHQLSRCHVNARS